MALPPSEELQESSRSEALTDEVDSELLTHLVNLDQTFVCFDVEQFCDATEQLAVSRAVGLNQPIAWRIRTNAPTRYIVNPISGILRDSQPVKITIRLVNNRFHPSHKLVVQAMRVPPKCEERSVWKHENAKNAACVHTINLELSTMLMNIDYTENVGNDDLPSSKSADSLHSIMAQSSTVGSDRIKELDNLLAMLKADTQQIQRNAEQAATLKKVLYKALDARKSTMIALKAKLIESKKQAKRWKEELIEIEAELENFQRSRKDYSIHQCSVF